MNKLVGIGLILLLPTQLAGAPGFYYSPVSGEVISESTINIDLMTQFKCQGEWQSSATQILLGHIFPIKVEQENGDELELTDAHTRNIRVISGRSVTQQQDIANCHFSEGSYLCKWSNGGKLQIELSEVEISEDGSLRPEVIALGEMAADSFQLPAPISCHFR